jgi:hypothetical protein
MDITAQDILEFIDGEITEMECAWEEEDYLEEEKIADLLNLIDDVRDKLGKMQEL